MKQGIEDGFLAPFKVINITTNIGDGWRPHKGQTDIYGNEIEDRIYNNRDYDYSIILQDRIDEVAREITEYLKSTDRMQKTIVFCASEDHAERMRIALINHNADMVKENPDYCVRITGSDVYGKSKLDYFISVSSPYPVIATTSELLSTGADCKMTKLIVLDKTVESMTTFKQIIGRGTRIREKDGNENTIPPQQLREGDSFRAVMISPHYAPFSVKMQTVDYVNAILEQYAEDCPEIVGARDKMLAT